MFKHILLLFGKLSAANIIHFVDNYTYLYLDFLNLFGKNPLEKIFIDGIAIMESILCFAGDKNRGAQLIPSFSDGDSLSALRKAVTWMKTVANKHPSNQLIQIKLAKEYLAKALRCVDSDSDSIYNLANVYLTVLNYITGQYQKATDHCTPLTPSVSHSQCSSYVVDGKLLPKIDDDIDNVLGLVVFYQYVRTATLYQRQTRHVSVFTTELFAHYFNIRHLLVAKCCGVPKAEEHHVLRAVESYLCEQMTSLVNTFASTPRLFVSDLMLCKYSHDSGLQRMSSSTVTNAGPFNKQKLVEFLTHLSIEQMLSYRQLMLPRVAEVATVDTLGDFPALRLYRCQLYERCTRLCQRTVVEIIGGRLSRASRLSFMYHEFVRLMDDNIVSLVGMVALADRLQTQSMFKVPISISQLTLLLYLLTQCRIKTVYSKWLIKADISPLADVLDWIGEAQKLIPPDNALDQLILKLAERLAVIFITMHINHRS